jgi:hypothetical protein
MRDYEPLPDDVGTVDRGSVGRLAVLVPAAVTVVFGILPGILFGFLRSASVIRF